MRRSKTFCFVLLPFIMMAFFPGLAAAASVNLSWNANSESDLAGYNVYYGTSSRHYGAPVSVGKVTGYTLQGLEAGKTYYFCVTAYDAAGNESGFSAEVSKTIASSGTTDPAPSQLSVTNLKVGSGKAYVVEAGLADGTACYIDRDYTYSNVPSSLLSLLHVRTANDDKESNGDAFLSFDVNKPVTVYVAHDDRIDSKPSWLAGFSDTGADLNTDVRFSIYVREFPAGTVTLGGNGQSSNCSMYTVMVREKSGDSTQPQPDTTAPSVAFTEPASGGNLTTEATSIDLAGTASDDVGVAAVKWANSAGGSGTATGTTSWSVSGVSLAEGTNTITVTAVDAAGNEGLSTLTITRQVPDTTAPTVSITRPTTSASYNAAGSSLSLSGTASDDKGVTVVKWSNSAGGSGTASGTGSWSVSGITLAEGTNLLTVTAQDAAGNEGRDTLTVYYTAPQTGGEFSLNNLAVQSGESYAIQQGIDNGALCYIDRTYQYSDVPSSLAGAYYIRTANDDKNSDGDAFLSFDVNMPVTVYVAHDDRIDSKPAWLAGFSDTGADLNTDVRFSIYAREFPAGTVTLGGNGQSSSCSMYTVMVVEQDSASDPEPLPPPSEDPAETLSVTSLQVDSGEAYVVEAGLADGTACYIDRDYTYSNVPSSFLNLLHVRTANDDKNSNGDAFLSFDVNKPVTVYVAHDDRIDSKPAWLAGFSDTGHDLETDVRFSVYAREFQAGTVTLGGNGQSSNCSMYTVLIAE